MHASGNLAGRMGRWSARHRRTAVFGWLAFVVLAVAAGQPGAAGELTNAERTVGPAAQAQHILDAHGWKQPASEMVLVQRQPGADEPPRAPRSPTSSTPSATPRRRRT